MKFSILTLFPKLYSEFFETSCIKNAIKKNLISLNCSNLFDFVEKKTRIDDRTFGHGTGMLIKPTVIESAVNASEAKNGTAFKIILSPKGKLVNQVLLKELYEKIKNKEHIMFISSRYEGLDARVEQFYADEILSVGDFVTMGGDIPCLLILEALLRFVPGVIGKAESVENDSFSHAFLDYPEFTKPLVWKDLAVPEVLRSGDHAKIKNWREAAAMRETVLKKFNWLRSFDLNDEEVTRAVKYIPNHYVALLHNDIILDKEARIGTTSVTSLDIHDIARSAYTYGCKNYFIVTELSDQRNIVHNLLNFWADELGGIAFNNNRAAALSIIKVVEQLEAVVQFITEKEQKAPIILATSAKKVAAKPIINYFEQSKIWSQERPVLFLFGTGSGLSNKVLEQSDAVLERIRGFTNFNHLSVRSAAAIIFDKWFGIANFRK